MNLSPETYAEICKQSAFLSALVTGFSFAFLGALLVSSFKSKLIDWVLAFSTLSIVVSRIRGTGSHGLCFSCLTVQTGSLAPY